MKQNYFYFSKNWLRLGFTIAFAASLSFNLLAQTAPTKQWDKSFGGNLSEGITSMQHTSDGGFILGGYSNSDNSGDKTQPSQGDIDYWIVKTDSGGNKLWDKTFGGIGTDYLNSIQQTLDNGYILGGHSNSGIGGDKSQANKGANDFWILKLDANGNKIWDKSFGGTSSDYLLTIKQTLDGGYILGGHSMSGVGIDKSQPSKGGMDYWMVKLDANGTKIWDKTFGGTNTDELYYFEQTSDGGYILGGFSDSGANGDKTSASKGGNDFWLVKLDASGNKLWDRTLGGSASDALYWLQQTADGGYILGGDSDSGISGDKSESSRGNTDIWVIKVDGNGNKVWDKTLGGSGSDDLFIIRQTSGGNYIIGGSSNSGVSNEKTEPSRGNRDFWTLKINSNGVKLWDKTLGGTNSDRCTQILENSNGEYLLGGVSESGISTDKSQTSNGFRDFWIVKLGADITGINETKSSFNLAVSPNPNQGKFKLQLSNLTASAAEVTITDLLGRAVLQKELSVTDKQVSEELTLPTAKGMYLLQVKAGQESISRKIVVE